MKSLQTVLIITIFMLMLSPNENISQQSPKPDWTAYKFLLGEWIGEGSGKPGEAVGSTIHKFDLDNQILIRNNHAEYPASNNRPAFSHDDLMIFYQENNLTKVIYFDNEGHVIHYTASFTSDSSALVLVGDVNPSAPRFKFSYIKEKEGKLKVVFEIAPPGKPEEFMKYVEGVVKKKN